MRVLNPYRGHLGAMPAFLGLVACSAVLAAVSSGFRSPSNLANLFMQGAAVAVVAMGLAFVLMLGEIDLAIAATGTLCGAVLAVLLRHTPAVVALPVALLSGALIGLLLGLLVTRTLLPSMAATLIAVLGLNGLAVLLLNNGTVGITDPTIIAIANRNLSPGMSWLAWALGISAYAMLEIQRKRRGVHHRTYAEPLSLTLSRVATSAVVSAVLVLALNRERSPHPEVVSLRGTPIVIPILATLVIMSSFVLRRTAFGRRLTLAADDRERAESEGINLDQLRLRAFVICSSMAAVGGVFIASRSFSATSDSGGMFQLIPPVAAALLGMTGAFSGGGRLTGALLGAAVITVLSNGLGLLSAPTGVQQIIVCLVVVIALVVRQNKPDAKRIPVPASTQRRVVPPPRTPAGQFTNRESLNR